MVLVPAVMQLLGSRNWWIPNWLERILPRLDVEHVALSPAEGRA
jgi:RND superfamily putative drug exporter